MTLNRRLAVAAALGATLWIVAAKSHAQGVITQWNFPPSFSTTSPVPSFGSGTAALVGGATATSAGGLTNAGSTEAVSGSVAWNTSTYPAAGTGSGTRGVSFLVSTTGQSNIVLRYDVRNSNTSSRYSQVEFTTDGGSSWQPFAITEAQLGGDVWTNNRTFDFSAIPAVNNIAGFGVRIVTVFDPNTGTDYTGTAGGYSTAGTIRYDAVTVSSGFVWTGADNSVLLNPLNYAGGAAPTTTNSTLLLGTPGAGNPNLNIGSGAAVDQVIFQNNAPTYNIAGGTNVLTVNAGIVNNSGGQQNFNTAVALGQSNSIFTTANSNVVFNEAVTFGNFIKVIGPGAVTLNGAVQGSFTGLTTGNPSQPTVLLGGGSTLFGTGSIGGSPVNIVDVRAGSRLQPGTDSAIGTMTVTGTVQLPSGATYGVKITGGVPSSLPGGSTTGTLPNPTSNNFLNILSGSASINATSNFRIDGTGALFILNTPYSYEIMNGAGDQSLLNINDPARFTLVGFDAVSLSVTGTAGGRVFLNFTPVPEPMLGLLALPLMFLRRRHSR